MLASKNEIDISIDRHQREAVSQANSPLSSAGTFNARAVRGRGVGFDPAVQTAQNTERSVRLQEKVLRKADERGGNVFG